MARLSGSLTEDEKKKLDLACEKVGLSQSRFIMRFVEEVLARDRNTLQNLQAGIKANARNIEQLQRDNAEKQRQMDQIKKRLEETCVILFDEEKLVLAGTRNRSDFDYTFSNMAQALNKDGIIFDCDWLVEVYNKYKADKNPDSDDSKQEIDGKAQYAVQKMEQ